MTTNHPTAASRWHIVSREEMILELTRLERVIRRTKFAVENDHAWWPHREGDPDLAVHDLRRAVKECGDELEEAIVPRWFVEQIEKEGC